MVGAPDRSATSRICVVGAGPCGLTALKNVLAAGLGNVVCYDDSDAIGGNWVYRADASRMSVYETTHIISSRDLSAFDDFPMPADYPDFPSHRQMLAYFHSYADAFDLRPHIRLNTRVVEARPEGQGWTVRTEGPEGARTESFDHLFVCSGHHRDPIIPEYAGTFAGRTLHSCSYRNADSFRGMRVLVVGGGNSACDIAADISRVAQHTCISMRRGVYIVPKLVLGHPIDKVYAFARYLPKPLVPYALRFGLWLYIGPWRQYGLTPPQGTPLQMHPTLNSSILDALRHGSVRPRPAIERLAGHDVHFADGRVETFDAIVWGTGFRTLFPFLPATVVDWAEGERPPLYLKMMHRHLSNIFFIGLFQPIGCIWNLADHQARIAVAQITGRLDRPANIEERVAREVSSPHWDFDSSPRHATEVDAHDFRRELLRELRAVKA